MSRSPPTISSTIATRDAKEERNAARTCRRRPAICERRAMAGKEEEWSRVVAAGALARKQDCGMVSAPRRSRADRPGRRCVVVGQRPEIPAVEGVRGLPVHEEDIAVGDDAAAVPDGQRAAQMIAVERLAHRDAVDGDRAVGPADGLAWKREDVLQQRHALRQVAALVEKRGERLRRHDHQQLVDMQRAGGMHGIEADRHAGAGVPDQPGRGMKQRRQPDAERHDARSR